MNPARLLLLAVVGGLVLIVAAVSTVPAAPVTTEPEKPFQVESCMKCHQDAKYDRLFWFAEK